MIGDKRDTVAVTAAQNIDFNADGGSVLVQLTGSGETVDFQTTPDGSTYYNIPYIDRTELYPIPSIAQISAPATAKIYLLLGPLSQVRIACGAGTLSVVYRTIQSVNLSTNTLVSPEGDSLVNDVLDALDVSIVGNITLRDLHERLDEHGRVLELIHRTLEFILGEEVSEL